mgnify:CR=1 FL=1
MSVLKLPESLEREPLVEAICEIRMVSGTPIADILPGVLFQQMHPKPILTRLPVSNIPMPIRTSDPSLQYAPMHKLDIGEYYISIGDRSVIIGCKRPYQKWTPFKQKIFETVNMIAGVGIAGSVERFSIKYVNIIEAETTAEQIEKVNLTLRVGELQVKDDDIQLKINHQEGEANHIITIATSAILTLPGEKKNIGILVDIDSIRDLSPMPFKTFAEWWEDELEQLRQSNKKYFFDCLAQETLSEMGPTYAS